MNQPARFRWLFWVGWLIWAAVAVQETNTARLVIVGFIVAFYSLTTFYLLNEGFEKVVSWMPRRATRGTDIAKVAGAAGAGGPVGTLEDK